MSENAVVPIGRQQKKSGQLYPLHLKQLDDYSGHSTPDVETRPYNFLHDHDVLSWIINMAEQSPTVFALFRAAQEDGWMVVLDDLSSNEFEIERDIRLISIDHLGLSANAIGRSIHYRNAILLSFVKALRHIWHCDQDYQHENTHRPESIVMIERAVEADCQTMAILAAWEWRGAGYAECWRYILGSEEGDMAMVFTRAIEKDPAGFYDGSVLTRTFCQWYGDSSRIIKQDHGILEEMDKNLKGDTFFGDKSLRSNDIETISRLPDGQIYLGGMGQNICTDPYFVSLDDPINESHLFQIVYDSKVVMVEGVPFRDQNLAKMIFPSKKAKTSKINP